jgi:molybdate transport system substrate-binding protein
MDHEDLRIEDLPDALGDRFLAIGHDRAVPAGIYAREALTSLGLWQELTGNIIQTDNVRAALRLVALGEAPFGVTYATDARAEPRVQVLYEFDPKNHSPIIYGLARLKESEEVDAYLAHLESAGAAGIFKAYGFRIIAE